MLIVKPSTVGIDTPIQGLQKFIYAALKKTWVLTDADWDCYGRAFRNQTTDGYTPEVFTGGMDYKDVFFDDGLKALSFFGVGENISTNDGDTTAKVFLIFMVNIPALKPAAAQIADEQIRSDVQRLVQVERFGFRSTGYSTGLDTVFKEYSGWKKKDGIRYRDMYPNHCFRIDFDLLYNINDC